jgi:hypothetical protein
MVASPAARETCQAADGLNFAQNTQGQKTGTRTRERVPVIPFEVRHNEQRQAGKQAGNVDMIQ